MLAALFLVPNSNRRAIHPTVRIVSRLNRAANASLIGVGFCNLSTVWRFAAVLR